MSKRQQVASDFNLTKMTTKDLSQSLRATIESGGNTFIMARRGSGKTEISKQIIKELGYREVYLNLSVLERPDLGGYPKLLNGATDSKFVDFMLPGYFRPLCEGDVPCVALLDEVDKASPDLNAPMLEFTQFRHMNGAHLKNLKAVIMTGNFASEGGNRPSLPLLDRAEKYIVEANHLNWLDWASKSGAIHPSITAYIADHPDDLFGDVDPGDVYADPSPRGWHNAAKILFFGEKNKWSPNLLSQKVSGCIGKKVGIKYEGYFNHYQILLPVVEKIMQGENVGGWDKLEPGKQMVACMIACARMSRLVDETKVGAKLPKETHTVGKFLLNQVDPEMSLISIRSQIGLDRMLNRKIDDEVKEWDTMLRRAFSRINGGA